MVCLGVPAGTSKPYQAGASNPGRPASAKVGTSGSSGSRCDPVTERALAEQFRVSRSPVREALRRLATQSVVSAHPDGGYAVADGGAAPPANGTDAGTDDGDEAEATISRLPRSG
ncbi:GntR family transcriptional regulator [Cupriavidus necator]|uniref:GntR family transcriptional regulator n=1 Tax=Cupriavidus necator TaxID=106590 RepID=UPI001E3F1A56|nr:GntR family transcriptional regulator [Cupriavidus necator]